MGDHAEFTLLERKLRSEDVTGCYLFTTLEPCAPGARKHPKLGCAERIVNARIAKVWVGIEDPDPTVDRKGIQYLLDKGIEVEMFDDDLQAMIFEENEEFLKQARYRAQQAKKSPEVELSPLEKIVSRSKMDELSSEALTYYARRAGIKEKISSPEFLQHLEQIQLIEQTDSEYKPTGLGVLLFGKRPKNLFPQVVLKAQIRYGNNEPEIRDFDEPLVLIPERVEEWLKKVLPSKISRKKFAREVNPSFPIQILREAVINALVHRDYSLESAKSYLIIDDNAIIVKSPGLPVKPIRFEDLKNFKAPSLSRNPKLMAIFSDMGYAEERGIGMETMKSLPTDFNLPLPSIIWNDPYIEITFPRSPDYLKSEIGTPKFDKLNEEERAGLLYLRNVREASKSDYAKEFSFDDKKAQRHLQKFVALKLVKRIGKGKATKYKFSS